MKRFFKIGNENTTDNQLNTSCSTQATSSRSLSLHERLKMSIGSVQENSQREESSDQFKKAFDQYDRFNIRGPLLDKLFDALCSIQPTSTQSERNFSLASAIATPKRSRMSSDKLNAICFLKSYFNRLENN